MGKWSISGELGDLVAKTGICFKYLQGTIYRQRRLTHFRYLIIFTGFYMVPDYTTVPAKSHEPDKKSGLRENNNKIQKAIIMENSSA